MKLNLVLNNLITIVCAFVTSQASYYIPPASQYLQQHYPHYENRHRHSGMNQKEDIMSNEITGNGNLVKIYDYPNGKAQHFVHDYQFAQQNQPNQQFNQLLVKQLTESAKDPKNLRNGIYHDGAITYDLGLPNYVVLNPYDTPEIITSNHPLYNEHMNHLRKTNNFTIEDFGVTSMPDGDHTISATASEESATSTYSPANDNEFANTTTIDTPEMTTKTDRASATATTITSATTTAAPAVTTATSMPIGKYEIKENAMQKFLSQTKEKLQILSNELQFKSNNNHSNSSISSVHNVSDFKQQNATTLETFPQSQKYNTSHQQDQLQQLTAGTPLQQAGAMFPLQINKNLKFAKSFYGQSVLLPTGTIPNIQQAYPSEDTTKHQKNVV